MHECDTIIEAAILAYEAAKPKQEWPVRDDGVTDILKGYGKFINERPGLLSLLYDIDMLPEQTITRAGAIRLVGLCEVWRKGENGELSVSPPDTAAIRAEVITSGVLSAAKYAYRMTAGAVCLSDDGMTAAIRAALESLKRADREGDAE